MAWIMVLGIRGRRDLAWLQSFSSAASTSWPALPTHDAFRILLEAGGPLTNGRLRDQPQGLRMTEMGGLC